MSRFTTQFAYAILPTSTTSDTFPSTGVNTGGLALTQYIGHVVTIKASEDAAIRAGSATPATGSLATANDYPLTADRDYYAFIDTSTAYVSVYGLGTAGTLFVAKASGI